MVSFDVESLFTNIPLDDCINLAVKYITEGNPGLKLSKHDLKRLFEFATKETHFLFKGNFYNQVDGVGMGSPLAPVLANLFMGHHENIWLDQYGDSEVLFYRCYVDDTFCLFRSEQDATFFFNYINNQHPNIRFTMEREADHVLPLLDVLINNIDPHQSVTTVYRKKTFTGLLTSYLSFCPFTYKLGLIKTFIDRTFKINNTWMGFHTDLQKLSFILWRNLFPENLINKYISKYIQIAVKGGKTLIQESSPRKHQSFSLKSLMLGTSQSRHRRVYANLLIGYVNLLI